MAKLIHCSGKRKQAIARATLKKGKGIIKINNQLIDVLEPKLARMKLQEPLILAGNIAKEVNINVKINGGGFMSQAEAGRLAIGRALSKYSKRLEKIFLSYDRHLLVADIRRRETRKPNTHGKARSKRQKSYR